MAQDSNLLKELDEPIPKVPVFNIFCQSDEFILNDQVMDETNKYVSNYSENRIPGLGHFGISEDPDLINHVIQNHLAE
jgi:pimeloyl-ACP methyl ester carboxylesterase